MTNTQHQSILLIDTQAAERTRLRDGILKYLPHAQIDETNSSAEALSRISQRLFKLIFIDIASPLCSVQEFLVELGKIDPALRPRRVVILSEIFADSVLPDPKNGLSYCTKSLILPRLKEFLSECFSNTEDNENHEPTTRKAKLDPATIQVFSEGLGLVLKAYSPFEVPKPRIFLRRSKALVGNIASTVNLANSDFLGQMVIVFTEMSFLTLVNHSMDCKFEKINDENKDFIAELANQVYGYSKRILNERGYNFSPQLPQILLAPDGEFKNLTGRFNFSYQFTFKNWQATIEIQVTEFL